MFQNGSDLPFLQEVENGLKIRFCFSYSFQPYKGKQEGFLTNFKIYIFKMSCWCQCDTVEAS